MALRKVWSEDYWMTNINGANTYLEIKYSLPFTSNPPKPP